MGQPAFTVQTPFGDPPIVVDLGGHKVTSDFTTTTPTFQAAVMVINGTLRNGTLAAPAFSIDGWFDHLKVPAGGGIGASEDFAKVTNSVFAGGSIRAGSNSEVSVYHSKFTNGSAISGNHEEGIHVYGSTFIGPGTGITTGDTFFRQDFVGSTFKSGSNGMTLSLSLAPAGAPSQIVANTVKDAPGDGISVFAPSSNTGIVVVGNTVTGSGGDGIKVNIVDNGNAATPPGGISITANNAAANAGYGIDVPTPGPDVTFTDGGGNAASGNGLGDCLNIACFPS